MPLQAITQPFKKLTVNNLLGLNLDLSDEKVPPNEAVVFTNMKIGDLGVPETVNGCSLEKAMTSSAKRLGGYLTRGEDYVAVYHADGKVRLWTYPDYVLAATLTPTFNEETWFANHGGELWVGNMSEGMYRWRKGHESEKRGSAPEDIIVEPYEEGEDEGTAKTFTMWRFSYDYELNGGRSALSRWARVNLFQDSHKVKLTVDTPPSGSKNRRIYAAYSTDEGTTWSDWYYVYEETDHNTTEIILDSELVSNVISARKYTEDETYSITPQAKFGISFGSRIWIAYTVDSPTKVQFSEVGRVYFNATDYFDLGEPITNLWAFNDMVVATTANKIWLLSAEPHTQQLLTDAFGAYENSVRDSVHGLEGLCAKGVWIFDGQAIKIVTKISSIDFSGLKKPTNFFLVSAQQDFEEGDYKNGISSDYIPGALCLQPNLRDVIGLKGILDRCQDANDYFGTGTHLDPDYYAQKFQVPGTVTEVCSLKYIAFLMRAYGDSAEDRDFVGEIRADNSGAPDMDAEALATWAGEVKGGSFYWREFKLSETVTINKGTDYWIVIPAQGAHRDDWQLYFRRGDGAGQYAIDFYPQGAYLKSSEDGGETWDTFVEDAGEVEPFLTFYIKGGGPILATSADLADFENDDIRNDSHDTAYAQRFYIPAQCSTVRGELLVYSKTGSPSNPAVIIEGDNNGSPDGATVATASSFTEPGDILRFNFDTQTLVTGTWYWLIVGKVGDASNYWEWGAANYATGNYLKIKTNGSWSSAYLESIWCKIFAEAEEDEADWRTEGAWVGPEFEIQSGDTFKKIYARMMKPTGAEITIKVGIYDGSWHYVTLYDSAGEIDVLPYDIETNYPSATKVKFTDSGSDNYGVKLEIGTANYTPIVDSLFVTYEKSGDDGDLLHVGIVNGEFWLSKDDADGDSSDTFTLVHDKFGNWHKLSECFYDYLQMEENVTLGIGKNSNETYQHIYKLDDSSVSAWYSGDTTSIDIDTEWESGWLLYDHLVKLFRKLFLGLSGDNGEAVTITISVSGAEYDAADDASYNSSFDIYLHGGTTPKNFFLSLPATLQGRWVKLNIVGKGIDWKFHGYEFHYFEKPWRNISISTLPFFISTFYT